MIEIIVKSITITHFIFEDMDATLTKIDQSVGDNYGEHCSGFSSVWEAVKSTAHNCERSNHNVEVLVTTTEAAVTNVQALKRKVNHGANLKQGATDALRLALHDDMRALTQALNEAIVKEVIPRVKRGNELFAALSGSLTAPPGGIFESRLLSLEQNYAAAHAENRNISVFQLSSTPSQFSSSLSFGQSLADEYPLKTCQLPHLLCPRRCSWLWKI